jgi:hypothetical protein
VKISDKSILEQEYTADKASKNPNQAEKFRKQI